jgi:hypothetical protein
MKTEHTSIAVCGTSVTSPLWPAMHTFSNLSSLVHALLPHLSIACDLLTRIHLASTCKLFRKAFEQWRCARLTFYDLLIDPLQSDVVLIRHWTLAPSEGRVHTTCSVRPTYKLATEAEMGAVIVHNPSVCVYFYGRLPCVPLHDWDAVAYLRGRSSIRLSATMRSSAAVRDLVFGRIDKEVWSCPRSSRGRYLEWHIPSPPCPFQPAPHLPCVHAIDIADVMRRALTLKYSPLLEGYVFDAVHMLGHFYP